MAFDRNQWKAASLDTVKKTVKEGKQHDTFFGNRSGNRANFYKNEDGVVVKRVLPPHKPGDSPYVPSMTAQLECEVEKYDKEGKVTGKEVANKKIFIATLHGGYEKDPIEEYIRRVYMKADENYQDKEEKAKFLAPVTGYRIKSSGKWVWGIKPRLEYVCYMYINKEIYRDTFDPKLMEALNRESEKLCAQNEDETAIDMFSDPTTGFPIQWDQFKDDKGKRQVDIKPLPLKRNETWDEYFEKHQVPDAVLDKLMEMKSLKELYVNCYRKRDFELALDGLKRFDDKNGYGIFADDEFLDFIEDMAAQVEANEGTQPEEGAADDLPFEEVPEKEEKKSAPVAKVPAKKAPTPAKKKAEPTDEEKLAIVNAEFVRQYGDDYAELELEGEELEEAYQLAIKHEDLGYDIDHVPGWDQPEEEPEPEEEPAPELPKKTPGKKTTAAAAPVTPPANANSADGKRAADKIREMRERRKQQQQ